MREGRTFLWVDTLPELQRDKLYTQLRQGNVVIEQLETLENEKRIRVPNGLIHHWIALSFIPGVTLQQVLALLQDYDHHEAIYKPDVLRSRLLIAVDELQPNLNVADNGVTDTVSVAFYDRRLSCPASGTAEAVGAGIALDPGTSASPGTPYGRSNFCVNTAIQFYNATLQPIGHNIRLSASTWDSQLNAPHPRCICNSETFIGDYFGNTSGGSTEYTTSVSTFDDGSNPNHYQQQVVASVPIPKL